MAARGEFQMVCLMALGLAVLGLQGEATPSLRLIPQPQQVTAGAGSFLFEPDTHLQLGDPADADDGFAARQLEDEARKDLRVSLRSGPGKGAPTIVMGRLGRDAIVTDLAKVIGLTLPPEAQAQGYVLDIEPQQIVLAAGSSAGEFYGIQTLRQLIRANSVDRAIPCCRIVDWPALQYRAWQHDISRGPIPKLSTLEHEVRSLSQFKLNAMTMYTEHVFKLKKHPTIAPADGITADEVSELVKYAAQYHVEVFGNFQSFGHFTNILNVPGYGDMGEAGSIISPASPKTYPFLSDVYSEICPAYSSPLFVINCDEVYGLGSGQTKAMVQQMGMDGVYAYHINKIADMLKQYGKTPMMWGDIALNDPAIIPKLPKDLIALSWGYDPRPHFDAAILPFTRLGLRFFVCPGVSCWSQIWPDIQDAMTNISNYVRDGAKYGAMGMLNTCWDDDGENLMNCNWYALAWGGECSWNPAAAATGEDADDVRTARENTFEESFDGCFYGLKGAEVSRDMLALSALRQMPLSGGLGDGAFWRDPLDVAQEFGDSADAGKIETATEDCAQTFLSAAKRALYEKDTLEYAEFAANRVELMAAEALGANPDGGPNMFGRSFGDKCKRLGSLASGLEGEYRKLWNEENRPWWLDHNLPRYQMLTDDLRDLPERTEMTPRETDFSGPLKVELTPLTIGATVRYTLDGSTPGPSSPVYTGPIEIDKSTTVSAASFFGKKAGPVVRRDYSTWVLPARVETDMQPSGGQIAQRAFDGNEQSYFWSDGSPGAGSTFTLVLDTAKAATSVRILTGTPDHPDDIAHHADVEVSADGTTFVSIGSFSTAEFDGTIPGGMVKAVRIRVTANNGNWLAIREIELR